jgi:lipid-A-disaccharide synthase-like uncharacterized protein
MMTGVYVYGSKSSVNKYSGQSILPCFFPFFPKFKMLSYYLAVGRKTDCINIHSNLVPQFSTKINLWLYAHQPKE